MCPERHLGNIEDHPVAEGHLEAGKIRTRPNVKLLGVSLGPSESLETLETHTGVPGDPRTAVEWWGRSFVVGCSIVAVPRNTVVRKRKDRGVFVHVVLAGVRWRQMPDRNVPQAYP